MKEKNLSKQIISVMLVLAMAVSVLVIANKSAMASTATTTPHVVINQVYGGYDDGNADHSFIELYNPTDSDVDMSSWSIQYRSSSGGNQPNSWTKLNLTGTIKAGGYYLIRCAATSGTSYEVPEGDQEWSIKIYNKGVSVALVNNQTQLADDVTENVEDNTNIIDLAACAGNDYKSSNPSKKTDQLPPAWEGSSGLTGSNGIQSKKNAIRRTNYVDTNVSVNDFVAVDYSEAVSSELGPHNSKSTSAQNETPTVVINEIESNGDTNDWVEIYNYGDEDVDISGWYILDNKPSHVSDVTPLSDNTILKAGEYYVFEENTDFTFGLGSEDSAILYNKNGKKIDSYSWTSHASGTYARIPNGTGDFEDVATSTKGTKNMIISPVVINEIKASNSDGWIELANPTGSEISVEGIVITDGTNSYTIPAGTTIKANGYLVIYRANLGFDMESINTISLYQEDVELDSTTWTDADMNPTWGRYPNEKGSTFQTTSKSTPGAENKFADIVVIDWPGNETPVVYDTTQMFLSDSSGLDFYNGQLYLIDNGTGTFWIMDVAMDGTLTFASGYENGGKRIRFKSNAGNSSAAGPDTEGITVDGNGYVYAAAERDNDAKDVNYNVILMVDPNNTATDLIALKEWNLTDSLPNVAANMGIEAVEWVSNAELEGKLYDKNTNAPYDSNNYPNATADGVFFVALESNGHVYAYILNEDETVIMLADIDTKLGVAMGLDYDTHDKVLRVATDNDNNCRSANITFTGSETPDIVQVRASLQLDTTQNYEGFAVADYEYTVDGKRPVYRFLDGVSVGALLVDYIVYDVEDDTVTTESTDTGQKEETTEEASEEATDEQAAENTEDGNNTSETTEITDSQNEEASVKTGDNTPIFVALIIFILSGGTATICIKKKKKYF